MNTISEPCQGWLVASRRVSASSSSTGSWPIARAASMPFMPGMRMSRKTSSGRCCSTSATASAPFFASPTISSSGQTSTRRARNCSRSSRSSSAMTAVVMAWRRRSAPVDPGTRATAASRSARTATARPRAMAAAVEQPEGEAERAEDDADDDHHQRNDDGDDDRRDGDGEPDRDAAARAARRARRSDHER